MKIQCENCGSQHELEPPSWVIASGRPFRFRCSTCGHSQMVDPPTGIEMVSSTLSEVTTAKPTPPRPVAPPTPTPPTSPPENANSVFLKQDGKVYLVRDWATLQRWIMEHRVGRDDMVSEGGVNWDRVGGRPELGSFFAAMEKIEAAELAGIGMASEAQQDDPPTSEAGGFSRLDEPTEGVPMGLPHLATEEIFSLEDQALGQEDEAYPEQPPLRELISDDALLPADPESSTIEEFISPPKPPVADVPEVLETAPPEAEEKANVVDFPDMGFEPHLSDEQPVVEPKAETPGLSLPVSKDVQDIISEFGDFGDFGDNEDTAASFTEPPTETDIPEPDPFPEAEEDEEDHKPEDEDEFIDPTELAAAAVSFDDSFGQDNIDGEDMLEVDNTEAVEADDAWDDFGSFFTEDVEYAAPTTKKKSNTLMYGLVAAGVIVGIGVFLGLFSDAIFSTSEQTALTAPETTTAPDNTEATKTEEVANANEETTPKSDDGADGTEAPKDDEATADDTETTSEDNTEEAPTEEEGSPVETKEPEPEIEDAAPAPTDEPIADASELVNNGWKSVDKSRFKEAVTTFEKVLAADPTHAEANYGMGYALIKQGKSTDAGQYLCAAYEKVADDASPEAVGIFRDVKGLLKNNQLVCEGA